MSSDLTPSQRRALEMIANGSPAMFHADGKDRHCSLCAAHIGVARDALHWAPLPSEGGVAAELRHLQWDPLDDLGNNISNGVDCCAGCGAGRSQPHAEDCEKLCIQHAWHETRQGTEWCPGCQSFRLGSLKTQRPT
jgi:hypothetical protein